jgi:hypothetical protein
MALHTNRTPQGSFAKSMALFKAMAANGNATAAANGTIAEGIDIP